MIFAQVVEETGAPTIESTHLFTMKILISNDDGYQAPGIVALYEVLKDVADVEVVAPEQNNSAKSNALTPAYTAVCAS